MAKRIADAQITRENFREDSDGEENGNSTVNFKKASEDVMRKRKIAQPRKKHMSFQSNYNESSMANAFSLGKKTAETKEQGAPSSVSSGESVPNFNTKLNALNLQFRDKVNEFITSNPVVDLSSVLDKYKAYLDKIHDDNVKTFASAPKEKVPKNQEPVASSTAGAKNDKGPTFTLTEQPKTSSPVFTFGQQKKRQAALSDSEDEVEIKGPSFTFTGNDPKAKSPFTFKPASEKSPAFGSRPSQAESKSVSETKPEVVGQEKEPAFNFVSNSLKFGQTPANANANASVDVNAAQQANTAPSSSFSFAFGKPAESAAKPSFSFGTATSAPTETKSMGDATSTSGIKTFNDDQSKAQITTDFKASSGSQKEPQINDEAGARAPTSLFGVSTPSASSSEKKPAFSFGSTTSTFGKDNSRTSAPAATPSFTFGKSSETSSSNKEAKPDTASVVPKPSFSFGKSTSTNDSNGTTSSKGFTVGVTSRESNQKAGSIASAGAAKPAFTFGTTSQESLPSKPAFSFGNSSAPSVPSFNFGTKNDTSETSTGNFKFSLPFSPEKAAQKKPDAEEPKQEEQVRGSPESEDENESSVATSMTNGEENEEVLFSQRAKLMTLNPETKGYDSKGVGELKVLRDKEDKSNVRILCRSDGMGHILLNTKLVKTFKYVSADETKENFVKCPVVNSDGKLQTYIVRVKQKADGRQLCKSIADAQNSM
ncbi:LAMI_0B02652g1_1 [Lachancea mirantina]|uniref:LAMI_0B02652g1_1 n=1 Tax=Lachancea mirantina TaxID=1230905 RepID=A0A1G4IUH4_9SACH|nr:LAMI_0B02652g1_1 [Lachancea mirantina]